MWLNEEQIDSIGLQRVNRPRWDYVNWAQKMLPKADSLYQHPFCKTLETALSHVVSRSLPGLTPLTDIQAFRYTWQNGQLELWESPESNLLYFDDPSGHAFLGSYRHSIFAFSYPSIGYTKLGNEFVPIFLQDSDLVEGVPYDAQQSVFFKNRLLENLDLDVIRGIERRLEV